jgi:amidohydrolase
MNSYNEIRNLSIDYNNYIVQIRRTLHQNPELSLEEYDTAKLIRTELDNMKIPWRAVDTGTVATLKGQVGGYTVALRADIDALPISENTGLTFSSKIDGRMHACGHDGHTAMLLGAAKILASLPERPNNVVFIFQPAEEHGIGALRMIEGGALEGVDTMYGSHVWPDLPTGKVVVMDGPMMAGADKFAVKVIGRGGHGSQPEKCIDPIPAVTAIVDAIHQMKSISLRGDTPLALTVCYVKCGTAINVIPDSGELGGTIRWFSKESQQLSHERIRQIAEDCAAMYGAKAEVEIVPLCGCTSNDADCAQQARNAMSLLFGKDAIIPKIPLALGSEDFSHYGEKVPTAFAWIGCGNSTDQMGLHNPGFKINEECLKYGAALYAQYAYDFKKR